MTKVHEKADFVKSDIRDLSRFPSDFATAAEPFTKMLNNRLRRLEKASDKVRPILLEEIQDFSDGLTNLEALFGVLCEMYCELSDAHLLCQEVLDKKEHDYQVLFIKEWKRNLIANRKKQQQ